MKMATMWTSFGSLINCMRERLLSGFKRVWFIVDRKIIMPLMQRLSILLARDVGEDLGTDEELPPWKAKSLREFHTWLQELPEGKDQEGKVEACDLFTLLSEFTALRQEIRLQNGEQSRTVTSVTGFLDTYRVDLDQYRKRSEILMDAEKRIFAYAEKKSVSPFLDVRESLIRGLTASRELAVEFHLFKSTKVRYEGVVAGYEAALHRFDRALAMSGVEAIETQGKTFDPKSMRVVQREMDESLPSGSVLRETASGFYINGEVLRHAEVIISE